MPTLYLIDGSAYIHRAYHAIAPLSNSRGLATNAAYGFTSILRRLVRERAPEYLAVAFDTRGPVFRHRMYADYKATRPPMPEDLAQQIPYIRETARAYGFLILEADDQEADDLIASAAARAREAGADVVVVSGDKDLLQLVGPGLRVWEPMKNVNYDEDAVLAKYGVGPERLLDFFALTGDTSDNVPGVPGVGPKTAAKFIGEHGTLEALYEAAPSLKKSKVVESLLANRDMAFLSRDLVRLNTKASVPAELSAYRWPGPDVSALRELWTELEFHTFLKDLSDGPGTPNTPNASGAAETAERLPTAGFRLVGDEAGLAELMAHIRALPPDDLRLAVDTETDGLDTRHARLAGVSLAVSPEEAWYLPCGHQDALGQRLPGQLSPEALTAALRPLLTDPGIFKIGHNLKFDMAILASERNGGIRMAGPFYDTMVGAWLLDPESRSLKLDDLMAEQGVRMTSFAEVTRGDKSADAFTRVSLNAAKDYSCEDVAAALLLHEHQWPLLAEAGLCDWAADVECPCIPVLADMEAAGVAVDASALRALGEEFGRRMTEMEARIHEVAGVNFNIASPKQLGEVLFERLGLPRGRKTKTGWSTDVKVLEKLASEHELPALVLAHRNLAKLKNTYVDRLLELRDPASGRVHSSFNQCGTATGRLSSSNPNVQNIPVRTEEGRRIRAAFTAPPGHVLVSADYSQIDLRVLAHFCGDEALVRAFREGADIHRETAAEIFGVMPDLVSPEMRRVAKSINFGIVYGMSSFGLSEQLGLGRKEAQGFIDRYFAHFPGIRVFMERVVEEARRTGYVATLSGRRRFLPDLHGKNRNIREFAERAAINTPIQGTAADIIKLAMLRLHQELALRKLQSRMILQIHDELVFEAPEHEVETLVPLAREIMEGAVQLAVPLVVGVGWGASLGKE